MTPQFDAPSRKAATGTLSEYDRAALDDALNEHPERRFDLEWDVALRARLEEKVAAMPALPGWERTEKLLADNAHCSAGRTAARR